MITEVYSLWVIFQRYQYQQHAAPNIRMPDQLERVFDEAAWPD
jgi:hypothetical protein